MRNAIPLSFLQRFVHYLIKLNEPSSIKHAVEIASTYASNPQQQVDQQRLEQCINDGKVIHNVGAQVLTRLIKRKRVYANRHQQVK